MRHAGVAGDHQRADAANAASVASEVEPGQDPRRQACPAGHPRRQSTFRRGPGDLTTWCPRRARSAPRPRTGPRASAGWVRPRQDARAWAPGPAGGRPPRRGPGREHAVRHRREPQVAGVGGDARPASTAGTSGRPRARRAATPGPVKPPPCWPPNTMSRRGPQRRHQPVAGRAAAVQVDGDVRRLACPGHRLELGGGQQFVDRAGQRDQVSQPAGCRQHDPVVGERPPDGPVGGHPGQEVTQAQGAGAGGPGRSRLVSSRYRRRSRRLQPRGRPPAEVGER